LRPLETAEPLQEGIINEGMAIGTCSFPNAWQHMMDGERVQVFAGDCEEGYLSYVGGLQVATNDEFLRHTPHGGFYKPLHKVGRMRIISASGCTRPVHVATAASFRW